MSVEAKELIETLKNGAVAANKINKEKPVAIQANHLIQLCELAEKGLTSVKTPTPGK